MLVAVLALFATLAAACGGDDEESDTTTEAAPAATTEAATTEAATTAEETTTAAPEETAATEEAPATEEATSTAAAASDVKVGLVTDVGGLQDRGFNQLSSEGLQRAATELGVQVEIRESKAPTDYVPNLSYFATQGYDLVVAVGFLMGKDVGTVAAQFPDVNFAIVDFSAKAEEIGGATNVSGLLFKEEEAGYLAGFLAGTLKAQGGFKNMNDQNVMSTVGGLKIPPVDKFIAGFQAGGKAANPDLTFLSGYSQDFVDQAKCKELAADQISKGSDVVFQVAGDCGLGALAAAGEAGVWGIGVDKDQSAEGPHVLTSAIKKVDEAVFGAAKAVVDGTFPGGEDVVVGVAEDGVGLGKISPDVPEDVVAAVNEQIEAIKAGSVTIPTEVP